MPRPARQARADAGLPGVEERRDAQGLQLVVQRIMLPVVGLEGLHARVELEPAHPVLLDEPPGSADPGDPAVRVDRAEGDEDVGVLGGSLGDVLVGEEPLAGDGLGVHGEDHRGHAQLPVVGGDLRHGRVVRVALEVLRGGGTQLVIQGVVPVASGLHVHVDGHQPVQIKTAHLGVPWRPRADPLTER
jgi:hypothetical protein